MTRSPETQTTATTATTMTITASTVVVQDSDEFAKFVSLAKRIVNTPKKDVDAARTADA